MWRRQYLPLCIAKTGDYRKVSVYARALLCICKIDFIVPRKYVFLQFRQEGPIPTFPVCYSLLSLCLVLLTTQPIHTHQHRHHKWTPPPTPPPLPPPPPPTYSCVPTCRSRGLRELQPLVLVQPGSQNITIIAARFLHLSMRPSFVCATRKETRVGIGAARSHYIPRPSKVPTAK